MQWGVLWGIKKVSRWGKEIAASFARLREKTRRLPGEPGSRLEGEQGEERVNQALINCQGSAVASKDADILLAGGAVGGTEVAANCIGRRAEESSLDRAGDIVVVIETGRELI